MTRLRKLRWQLMLSYIPLVFVPVLLVSVVTRGAAEQGLTLLVTQGAQQQSRFLSKCFVAYYETHKSWDGLSTMLRAPEDRGWRIGNPRVKGKETTVSILRSPIFDFNMNCHMLPDQPPNRFDMLIPRPPNGDPQGSQ